MKKTHSTMFRVLPVSFLATPSGCGGSNLPEHIDPLPCFPFVCQPTPAAPSVSTDPAANVTSNTADLNGHVSPHGKDTGGWFEGSTLASMASYSQSPSQLLGAGNNTLSISATVSGLTGSTTYHYRTVAYTALGTSKGNTASFTTL